MCGIVGVLGNHEVAPLLVEALKRLEYRGYDSAGIATVNGGTLDRRRAVGKLVNLSDRLVHEPLAGKAGIGHTRWATHGAATERNAHPHRAGKVAVVHNGIIENFREIRERLAAEGLSPETETDTETVVMLVRHYLDRGLPPREAVRATLGDLHGAFALLFLFEGEDDLMIAARKGSPLAVGYGDGEMFVGSDAIALAPMTDRIAYLEEGDHAFVTRKGVAIFDREGRPANREVQKIAIDQTRIEKGGYKHFMAKEIAQQPAVIADALAHYVRGGRLALPNDLDFSNLDRLTLVACGTASYACLTAKYWFEQLAALPCEVDIASEFRYREPPLPPRSYALFVSQSGETADTLAALRYAEGKVEKIVSVINVPTSSIARESDIALPILAGVEVGVASTKAFTCQLTVLAVVAIALGRARGILSAEDESKLTHALVEVPRLMAATLALEPQIEKVAREIANRPDVLYLGRGTSYPLAMEGALKLKEISYIHAEGYAAGELKHGPIALIDEHMPVVVIAPYDRVFDKTVSNMQEVAARGGKIILMTDARGAKEATVESLVTIVLPDMPATVTPLVYAIPVQLLAYHAAVIMGTDVDQPRNLAKSVTVE